MAIELKARPTQSGAPAIAVAATPRRLGKRSVSHRERAFLTERLALMLEAGGSLHESLDSLAHQAENPRLRTVIRALRHDIAEGLSFSQALAKHPETFSRTYVNLIAAGERAGFLPKVLQRLMELEEHQAQLRASLLAAFSYPVFLICFSVAVVLFVLGVVFPKFGDLFANIANELPATTVFLLAASDVLRQYWHVILAGSAGVIFLTARWARHARKGPMLDRLKLRLPILRDIMAEVYLSHFMRVLGLSLTHGVSVPDALRACQEVIPNSEFREFLEQVRRNVNEGKGISVAFRESPFVPSLVRQMVATGEEAGNVGTVMNRLADFYQRELTRKLNTVAKMVEPLMLLVMGVIVGLIVSSLILPIFKLSRAVT